MITRDQSPPLLPSSYVTVLNRNDNQRHLIGYTWIEKSVKFLHYSMHKYLQKHPCFAIDIPKKTNTFITFVKLIIVYRNTEAPS